MGVLDICLIVGCLVLSSCGLFVLSYCEKKKGKSKARKVEKESYYKEEYYRKPGGSQNTLFDEMEEWRDEKAAEFAEKNESTDLNCEEDNAKEIK